jgi:hypothetical protein
MSTAEKYIYQWQGRMSVIKDTPDTFDFELDGKRFCGSNRRIDALCRSLKDQTLTLVDGFAEEVLKCLRCGPFGGPYRFGITHENTKDKSSIDLIAFATNDGHFFIETMEPIAPNTFEIALGS